MGTPAYVQYKLQSQLLEQAQTMRAIVRYANDESRAARHLGHGLSRGIALQLLRFCATARNVHFLRARPQRIVGQAIEDHDAAILQTLAGITAQTLTLPDAPPAIGAPLGPATLTDAFEATKARAVLPFNRRGRGIRRRAPHPHAPHPPTTRADPKGINDPLLRPRNGRASPRRRRTLVCFLLRKERSLRERRGNN